MSFLIKFVLVWPPANLTGYAISVRKVRALKIGFAQSLMIDYVDL